MCCHGCQVTLLLPAEPALVMDDDSQVSTWRDMEAGRRILEAKPFSIRLTWQRGGFALAFRPTFGAVSPVPPAWAQRSGPTDTHKMAEAWAGTSRKYCCKSLEGSPDPQLEHQEQQQSVCVCVHLIIEQGIYHQEYGATHPLSIALLLNFPCFSYWGVPT